MLNNVYYHIFIKENFFDDTFQKSSLKIKIKYFFYDDGDAKMAHFSTLLIGKALILNANR